MAPPRKYGDLPRGIYYDPKTDKYFGKSSYKGKPQTTPRCLTPEGASIELAEILRQIDRRRRLEAFLSKTPERTPTKTPDRSHPVEDDICPLSPIDPSIEDETLPESFFPDSITDIRDVYDHLKRIHEPLYVDMNAKRQRLMTLTSEETTARRDLRSATLKVSSVGASIVDLLGLQDAFFYAVGNYDILPVSNTGFGDTLHDVLHVPVFIVRRIFLNECHAREMTLAHPSMKCNDLDVRTNYIPISVKKWTAKGGKISVVETTLSPQEQSLECSTLLTLNMMAT